MTIQDTCLHHKHTREREQLGPNNKSVRRDAFRARRAQIGRAHV